MSSRIERNVVRQRAQPAFAGLMLAQFQLDGSEDPAATTAAPSSPATRSIAARSCASFGMQIGPGPWSNHLIVVGGDVHD